MSTAGGATPSATRPIHNIKPAAYTRELLVRRVSSTAIRPRTSRPILADATSRPTIRYYGDIGVLQEAKRTPAGYREYDDAALDRLAFVRAAQVVGLTLGEIRQVVALRERGETRARMWRHCWIDGPPRSNSASQT